ncbi:MAG: ORF2 [Henan mamastrovirus 8]|nr:MAG: ORF2 [Henan mamastrovirus 8]
MANRQQKRGPRTTTNIVVRNGTAAPQARASGPAMGSRRRRNRARRQAQVNVRVLPSQNQNRRRLPRRQGIGSRIVFQKINSTLGTVGSNGSEQIECELTCLLNPATMKEATGSNSFTPLGIYASTYSLFRMTRCTLVLKPLIGDNAVSGTVVRASWNPTSTPTQASWSSLGARKHIDVTPGKTARFTLTGRDLVGPKGGWFKTNTNGDPMMSFAGTIEIHTLGKTMSTYRGAEYTGGLFLVEMESHWQFKDYGQQPGMLNLVKGDDDQNARVKTSTDGKLQLVLPGSSRMARASRNASSDIIWLVTDTIIQTGSAFLGPFGWLLRGGWWIIKRAAGAPVRAGGETTFDIYASISDARSNSPCITDQEVDVAVGHLHYQQLTPGNTGIDSGIPNGRSLDQPVQTALTHCYVTSSAMIKKGTTELVPATCIWYNRNYGQMHEKGAGFEVNNTKVATFNIYKVDVTTNVGPIDFAMFEHRILIKLYGNSNYTVGWAVASSHGKVQDHDSIWVSSLLVYAEFPKEERFAGPWDISKVTYPDNNHVARVTRTRENGDINISFEQRGWYILQYVVQGQVSGDYYVGDQIVATRSTHNVSSIPADYTFTPTLDRANVGVFPAFATGLRLKPFTSSEVRYVASRAGDMAQPAEQTIYSDLEPSFGCDDALEFPPPPSDEDLADGACEFEPFSDSEAENYEDPEEDEDEELELGPDDDYSDPPISRLVVVPEAQQLYEQLRANFPEREARLAVNQLNPSGEYAQFTAAYHNALVDGLSPRDARAFALGL